MLTQIRSLFRQVLGGDSNQLDESDIHAMNLAMASLLCEVANADHNIDPREEKTNLRLLTQLLDLNEDTAGQLLEDALQESCQSVSLYQFTDHLRDLLPEQRYALIEAMWQVAYADEHIDPQEEAVIRQVAELIYLDHNEFIRAKISAKKRIEHECECEQKKANEIAAAHAALNDL